MSQSINNFSNAYERSMTAKKQGDNWMLRAQGFHPLHPGPPDLAGPPPVYDTGEMLPEIVNMPWQKTGTNVFDNQIQSNLLSPQVTETPNFMNPHIKASSSSSYHHKLVPNSSDSHLQGFNHYEIERSMEGQALSLSLSSSLRNFEASKFDKTSLVNGDLYFNGQEIGGGGFKYFGANQQLFHSHRLSDYENQVHFGLFESSRTTNGLRNSRYLKPAQDLLEEFCYVGRGQLRNNNNNQKFKNQDGNPNSIILDGGTTDAAAGTSSLKDQRHNPISPAERSEYQRRKIKLLSMIDEVDARYTRYCEQMQGMVNTFDSMVGKGAATTYTAMAQKAMSRHFRCIKDAIVGQLKQTCEYLGEKDVTFGTGLTKGETPRLKMLEQKYRQQKALQNMGMLEPESWRPQRGLPERSVLAVVGYTRKGRLGWLYPSEADKHLLSRQTGLSKNQVSNWFINARVRLWKPMVEEMYKQEFQDEVQHSAASAEKDEINEHQSQTPPMHKTGATISLSGGNKRLEINGKENNTSNYSTTQLAKIQVVPPGDAAPSAYVPPPEYQYNFGLFGGGENFVRAGTQAGDVSLTLGLRHSENVPRMSQLSITDFEAYS
ncbi:hypothetical protein DH2020_035088 [Rehmannia glutinosa]|uniref:Homeobox domain-containing protein n=1 Tax=Rehmannia glutinosa TaxID=99300 RepID=A0ABR0V7G3_REHGL